ncbi:MAG: DUF4013 domain-containing protein [Chryseobacterium sp.]|jgi:uncharacterized membrane protein|uniref:DUF4013 domain-containing protein n=1 Tax=Chryseobacterium sp. TaxID=1871047 RepID=UPI00281E8E95|nr:DUF4013 domain-containing protein [Chryseobacterium sp.]MDR2237505.1 DUF4013 domain-containing protein [Chryseobacterium sp.]
MNNFDVTAANGYEMNIGKFISEGVDLFKKDIGGFIVATILLFLMSIIPFLGVMALGNFYKICRKVDEGQKVQVGDIFDFTDFVTYLKFFVFIFVICFIIMIPIQLSLLPVLFAASSTEGNLSDTGAALFAGGMGIWFMLVIVLLFAVTISMYFVQPLISLYRITSIRKAYSISWKLARRNFLMILVFSIVVGVISQIGAIVCGIGILFTIPLGICIKYASFKNILGSANQKTV